MKLCAGNMHVEFDDRTGAMVRIEDRATGLVHVERNPDQLLFRITVPRGTWTSRHVDNHMARPTVVQSNERRVVLRWDDIPAADGTTGIDVEVCAEAAPDAHEVRFTIDVKNRGPDRIIDVCFPVVSGWTGIGGAGADSLVLGGHLPLDPHRFPLNTGTTYARIHQKYRVGYPVGLYAPWADLSGPGGGLSYIHYMPEAQNGVFFEHNMARDRAPLRLALGWRTPCVIQPGETWRSHPVGLSPHAGDWHTTADRYIAWMQTWFQAPPSSPARRRIIGFQNVFLRGFDGWPVRPLESVPQIAADGRRFGVHDLCIWDEVSIGNYERMDERDVLAYPPDEAALLRKALKEARDAGTNVNALVNFRLMPGGTRLTAQRMDEALRLLDGSPHTENYGLTHHALGGWCRDRGPNCYISSAFSRNYRQRVHQWTRQYLDLGYVSMFYDQPFEAFPDYGRIGDGQRPEDTYAAVVSLVAEVRRMVHENDPGGYLIGEFCEAFMSQHIDLWMSWYTDVRQAMLAAYSIPQTMHSWVVDNDPGQASRAFAMGMYLCLCTRGNEATLADEPAFGEHVLRLANLRRKAADRTVHARFRDRQGIQVKADGPGEAYAFDGAAGPAVIATSPGQGGTITIEIDRSRFTGQREREARLLYLDGREEAVTGDRLRLDLPADDVVVWAL